MSIKLAKRGPVPFFAAGAVLFCVGAVLQTTNLITLPNMPLLGETPFGVFSKLGGLVVLIGLGIAALRSEGSSEPDLHIPQEIPQSARGPQAAPKSRRKRRVIPTP